MRRRAVISGGLESPVLFAALGLMVTCASILTPNAASAQVEESNASTPNQRPDDDTQKAGLWRVRLKHELQHQYSPPKPIEEVVVRGKKPLSAYRRDVDAAEVEVWEAFNDANSDDQFDVTCRLEVPLGTRIPQQVCRPRFLDKATSRAAGAMLQLDKSSNVGLQQIEVNRAHYLERQLGNELRGLAMSEPEVQERVGEYADKTAEYDEARSHR